MYTYNLESRPDFALQSRMSRPSNKGNPEQPRGSQRRVFGNKTKKKGKEIMGPNDITLGFGGGGSGLQIFGPLCPLFTRIVMYHFDRVSCF